MPAIVWKKSAPIRHLKSFIAAQLTTQLLGHNIQLITWQSIQKEHSMTFYNFICSFVAEIHIINPITIK